MTQTRVKSVTYEEFIEWYPENSLNKYELHKGVIVEMPPPTGKHEGVIGFLAAQITFLFLQMGLPYRIPKTAFVKIPKTETVYSPDILVQNYDNVVLVNGETTIVDDQTVEEDLQDRLDHPESDNQNN